MAGRILLCSACGTKNKIPEGKQKGKKAVCGNCGKELAIKGNRGSILSSLFSIIINLWFVWVLGFIFIVIPYFEDSGSKSSHNTSSYQSAKIEQPPFTAPPVQINHGIISKSFAVGVAPLEIRTRYGNNYYIKIVNTSTNQAALTAYVVGGRPFEVLMPLGTYEIRYAAGDTWYGTEHYFGPDTAFSKANELFHFTFDGYQYSGYTVELILQAHGNLRTVNINEADF